MGLTPFLSVTINLVKMQNCFEIALRVLLEHVLNVLEIRRIVNDFSKNSFYRFKHKQVIQYAMSRASLLLQDLWTKRADSPEFDCVF
jgi:hypothetical protein